MRDKIIESVVNKIISRSDVGYKKYKVTLQDDDQTLDTWLNHIQEELMDAVYYIEKARQSLRSEVEECYFRDIKRTRKKGPVRSKKVEYDGHKFASGLEKYMYQVLKKAKIRAKYEGETFVLVNGFHFENEVYERQANSKGDFMNRGEKRILPIKYTPDFIGENFIIECKGRPNESFPIRWKLFKQLVTQQFPGYILFKPQNQKECDETIRLILESKNN